MAKGQDSIVIYQTALKIFARYGYKRARIEDVARELGVVSGTLYRYVKSKEDLYLRSVKYAMREWIYKTQEAIEQESDWLEKFRILAKKGYEYLTENSELRQVLIEDPTLFSFSPGVSRVPEIREETIVFIKRLLRSGVRQGVFCSIDVDVIAELLFSIFAMFIVRTYLKSDWTSAEDMYFQGLELVIWGLVPRD